MNLRSYIFFVLIVLGINVGLVHAQSEADSIPASDIVENSVSGSYSEAEAAYRQNSFAESIKLYESEIGKNKQIKKSPPNYSITWVMLISETIRLQKQFLIMNALFF